MTHEPLLPRPSKDDELDAELRAEIRTLAATIDTIIKKVDETDPVFRKASAAPEKPQPQVESGHTAPYPSHPQERPANRD